MNKEQFDMFSFYYLIGYVLFSLLYIVFLKQNYKKEQFAPTYQRSLTYIKHNKKRRTATAMRLFYYFSAT
ncbi:hypothetical protein ACT7CT_09310 [Bacillus sanguinis]